MKLIQQIKIENFRSIEIETIQNVGEFNILVGKNSSGKSNVLRALNLFFNGEVEPGNRPFDAKFYAHIKIGAQSQA